MMLSPSVSIVIPTYNEAGNIGPLIDCIQELIESIDYEIIVVDDSSEDETCSEVQKSMLNNAHVKLIKQKYRRGLAESIHMGIRESVNDLILVMDADFTHDPKQLPLMIKLGSYFDLVSVSRFVYGGGMQNNANRNQSYLFNLFIRLILKSRIKDHLGGYYITRKDCLLDCELDKIFLGYGDYYMSLLNNYARKPFSILEVPGLYHNRLYGVSKSRRLKMIFSYSRRLVKIKFFGF